MNGELYQVIALASAASAWLRDPSAPSPELDASTYAFIRSLTYALDDQPPTGSAVEPPEATAAWLGGLRDRRVDRLWLALPGPSTQEVGGDAVGEHQLVAFAGAGSWHLLGTATDGSEEWFASWRVGDRTDPNQRIRNVEYRGRRIPELLTPQQPDLEVARSTLGAALVEIQRFAAERELVPWTEVFAAALARLEPLTALSPDAVPAFADDRTALSPAHPPAAHELFAASEAAWVFGGMGSWNDLGFTDPEENATYDRLSADLYAAVLGGLLAATNAPLA